MSERTLAGSFQTTLNLTDKRGISVTGHIYSDDSPAEINARIDMIQDVLDRQSVRADLVNKRAQIEGHRQNLKLYKTGYEELVKKQHRLHEKNRKLPNAEQQAIDNYDSGVAKASEMIQSLESAIAAGEARLKE